MRETPGNAENATKLEAAEARLQDLKSNMAVLGKEAAASMSAVEAQQQRLTLQRLIAMVGPLESDKDLIFLFAFVVKIKRKSYIFFWMKVEAERTFHKRVLHILEQLEGEVYLCFPGLFLPYS